MERKIAGIILMLLVLFGCERTEIVQLDMKGTIKGRITTLDKFRSYNNDNNNILIKLEGSQPLLSILTDSTGRYELNNIPSGTYNLVITKEGYGEYQIQGLQLVGGEEPLYFDIRIFENSDTKIENISIEVEYALEIYLQGDITHNYGIVNPFFYPEPAIRYFVHSSDNPSDQNYLQTGIFPFNGASGSQFYFRLGIDRKLFSSGSTIYVVAYGCSTYENKYYDILSNKFKYTGLGAPSNITSVTIP